MPKAWLISFYATDIKSFYSLVVLSESENYGQRGSHNDDDDDVCEVFLRLIFFNPFYSKSFQNTFLKIVHKSTDITATYKFKVVNKLDNIDDSFEISSEWIDNDAPSEPNVNLWILFYSSACVSILIILSYQILWIAFKTMK